jgi:prepilin-type N-terminal cleavage/methylation domain-containing protein
LASSKLKIAAVGTGAVVLANHQTEAMEFDLLSDWAGWRRFIRVKITNHGEILMSKPSSFKSSQAIRGFTLIELLVVIAIIGILSALLLPVLSKAKNRASQVTDLNNLKEQTTALNLYCSDHDDIIPWPNWDGGGLARPGWLYTADLNATGPDVFKVETGLFWTVLHNPKLYFCPMDNPTASTPDGEMRPQQISSYAMNGAVVGFPGISEDFNAITPVKLQRLQADDCAFWETDETHPLYFNDGANYPGEGVSARHLQGGIQGTFGGAVSYVKLKDWYNDVDYPNRNRLWCNPNSPDGGNVNTGHNPE